jgi:glycosyltransferase involved in cell wall biosynthesis
MKILHVMPYCPIPANFGGALRIYHILKNLIRYNDVTVLMYGTPEDEKNMRAAFGTGIKDLHVISRPWTKGARRLTQIYSLCTGQSFFHLLADSRKMQLAINRIFDKEDFDFVFIEFPHMAGFDFKTDAKKILDAHNVEYEIYRQFWLNSRSPLRRLHYRYEYQNLYKYEVAVYQKQDAIFVTSENDKKVMDQHSPEIPKFVVPNGVDTEYFQNGEDSTEPFSLIFSGTIGYVPNYDGVTYFLDNIFPLIRQRIPEVKIYIVGNSPPRDLKKRNSENIIVTDYVPDVRPYFEKASVYVVPLRLGSGTRLKILEAMAMHKPVVTTSIGGEGIDIVHGETALIADRPEDFAGAVVDLLRDPALREKLARNGNELVRQRYDWSVIGQLMNSSLLEISGNKKTIHSSLQNQLGVTEPK